MKLVIQCCLQVSGHYGLEVDPIMAFPSSLLSKSKVLI